MTFTHEGNPETSESAELATRSLRAVLVLEALVNESAPVSAQALASVVGLPKQTLHRLLNTLTDAGFLQSEVDSISYVPGRRLRRMTPGLLASGCRREERLAILEDLAADLGETCNLCIPDDDGMIYLERVETDWPLRVQLPAGSKVPFHCTASGKLHLSTLPPSQLGLILKAGHFARATENTITDPLTLKTELEHIKASGHAEDNGEYIQGMVSVSVPVLDQDNNLLACLAVYGPSARLTIERARHHVDRLRQAAADLSEVLCDWP